ncbi:beta-ketoacyl-[acyl-carrier-protein] synthase family protein [Parapedobacter indicus]|uniref:3-oxoacyl-[acyl-carrier-protein] synthase 1 n=1 Tax=Parapedobacter indicus TaxID=1477437 RepID=A0A1I3FH05_9SPHI|nr:beta-ketoacyl-[acyl-carrier-protein] synthase family protein [Parapedobacter indicus]PPL03723.1 3-oxoacyl-[acyl-carrier-protein] synthase-1 [Parapedobacter indicus]SFI10528.1 3-oxoacyl-[acyl-carrier-protein] synthase-1 [Parapedobacter indicus]
MERRVVISGMGIYSSLGKNLAEVKESLYLGRSGIVFSPDRKEFGYRSALTGFVEKPDLAKVLSRRQRISMGEESEYAYVATREALQNAKIEEALFDEQVIGLVYGNDSVSQAVMESIDIVRQKKDTMLVGSGAIFKSMNSSVTMNLSTIYRVRGINMTISAACASGSHAIGLAYLFIKQGLQDCVICGGAQETNKYAMASFDGLGVFSDREDQPTRASRPFDQNRNGLVPGGGAATLVLEEYESAVRRGAPILAEVLSYGFSSNGDHISTPNVEGPIQAMEMALQQAGLAPGDIEYINAHATSTPMGDANEARALTQLFGSAPYISSTKSMTGHECWMAGTSEVVYSLLMAQHGFIAPNINLEEVDETAKNLSLVKNTINQNFNVFLSNSFGFGGTNSALIVKKL